MATASYANGTSQFSGGSADDRLNLTTCAEATTELTLVYDNVAYQTTPEARSFNFANNSFSDFTGALLMMRNNGNHQAITFRLGGDVVIGDEDDLEDRGFELVIGDRDLFNIHTSEIDLCDQDAQIVCLNQDTRLIVRHILDIGNSSLTGEPGARNGIQLQNNNANSALRMTLLGGRAALDSDYIGVGGSGYGANKPAGTEIFKYDVTEDVAVRDIEWYSGYLDWRPDGDWAPPTRAVFSSESGIKFLVNSEGGRPDSTLDDPLIFGEAGSSFVLTLGTVANSWWLEGLSSSEDDFRTVYLNMDGPNWATQVALFDAGKSKVIENHLVVDYTIIDALANPIEGAFVRLHSRDPQISARAASGTPTITFPEANARINTSTSDANGRGSLGGATGAYNQAVVVEAFGKRITGGAGGTGTVDGAYTAANHAKAVYNSYADLEYDVFSFGRQIVTGVAWTAALSGQDGAGKQNLGVIQLNDEVNLSSANTASVPSTASTFDDVFDILYDWAIINREPLPFTVSAGEIDFGSLNVTFSTTSSLTLDIAGGSIVIPSMSTLNLGSIITALTTMGTFTYTGVTITGRITDTNGTPSTVTIIADDGDTVAYYLSDGTEISRSTLSGTDRVTFGLTPAQSAAGQRISVVKPGFESRIRTISTNGGGVFTTDMASLIEKRGPDGVAQFDSTNLDARVSVDFNLTNLANTSARIDIGNAQVRAAHAFNEFEMDKITDDGMKYIAFGGSEPGILQDPVNGDALYLPSEVRIRRATAGDSNATILATVYHVDGTPVDDANGDVSIVGGRILDDFAQTILVETDLDLERAGLQSLASLMVNVRKELVTHGVGAELTVVVIYPKDSTQRDTILNFRSGDDITIGGTDAQVFSQVVNEAGVYSIYLIGRSFPINTPLVVAKGTFSTSLSAANMQTTEDDISAVGHWAVRETTIVGFMLDMRDRIDATRTAAEAAPSSNTIVTAIQNADFESGAGTNTLAQMLGLIRTDIADIPSSGGGMGTGGDGASTDAVLDALGYLAYGSNYRSTWIAGAYALDSYALHSGIYYRCIVVRDSTHTNDPSVDTTGWEVAGLNALFDPINDSTNGLAAIKMAIDDIPTNNPSANTIVTALQNADFEEGTGTKTISQLLADIIEGENTILALEQDILGVEQNILDALNTRRIISQAYTFGAGIVVPNSSLFWFNNAIPDDEFVEAFNESPDDTRHPTALSLDNRDLSLPANAAIPGNISLSVGENATDITSTTTRLSDRFERTWELLIEYEDDSWRFTHDEFDLDQTVPYQWTTDSQDVRDRIGEVITTVGSNANTTITFFTDNISLRSIEQEILQVAMDTEDHILTHIGAAHFGTHFRGVWRVDDYALEDVVWFNNQFYEARGTRTMSDTDDPSTDSTWRNAHTPSADEILSSIQNASFSDGGGDATLSVILGRITNRIDHDTYGLQALGELLEHSTYGLQALGVLITSSIQNTLNSLGYMIFGSDYQGSWDEGTYAIGQYVVHESIYYRCIMARVSTDTDNPSIDTDGWEVAEIYSTISPLLDTNHGLSALQMLINDIPTDNSLSQSDFNTLMNDVTQSIKNKYQANVSSIPTDNSLSQSDFDSLMDGVATNIKNSYQANVASLSTITQLNTSITGLEEHILNANNQIIASISEANTNLNMAIDIKPEANNVAISLIETKVNQLEDYILNANTSIHDAIDDKPNPDNTAISLIETKVNQIEDYVLDANTSLHDAIVNKMEANNEAISSIETKIGQLEGYVLDANTGIRSAIDDKPNPDNTTISSIETKVNQIEDYVLESNTSIHSAIDNKPNPDNTTISSIETKVNQIERHFLNANTSIHDAINDNNTILASVATLATAIQANQEDGDDGFGALKTLIERIPTDNPPTAQEIATAVNETEVVTGLNVNTALKILVSIGGGKVVAHSNELEIYSLLDDNHIITIPKFVGNNRSNNAELI